MYATLVYAPTASLSVCLSRVCRCLDSRARGSVRSLALIYICKVSLWCVERPGTNGEKTQTHRRGLQAAWHRDAATGGRLADGAVPRRRSIHTGYNSSSGKRQSVEHPKAIQGLRLVGKAKG